MSSYCKCCSSDEAWVEEHLNWIIDPLADSLEQAQECFDFWNGCNDPLECSVEELAKLFRNIVYRNRKDTLDIQESICE